MGQICPVFQQHWYARESQKFQRTVPHHCPSPTAAPSPVISTKDLLHPSLPAFPRNTPFRQFIMTFCPGLSMRWTKARQSTNLTSSRASCYMHTYSSTQTHHLFCYGKNMHNIKLNILTFLSEQLNGIKYIHTVGQLSPLSISRASPSSQTGTLWPLNINSPSSSPQAWQPLFFLSLWLCLDNSYKWNHTVFILFVSDFT